MSTDLQTAPVPHRASRRTAAPTGLVVNEEDRSISAPLVYCDGCSRRITNAKYAGVAWRHSKNKRPRPIFLCKNGAGDTPSYAGCLSSPVYRDLPWQELTGFLMSTLFNVGITSLKQVRSAWELSEMAARIE